MRVDDYGQPVSAAPSCRAMAATDVNSLFARAEQAFLAGQTGVAHDLLTRIRRIAGDQSAVLHLLALVEKKRGNFAVSRANFERALQLAPADAGLHVNYANFLAGLSDPDLTVSLSHYERALKIAPTSFGALSGRILLLQKVGRLDEAIEDVEALLKSRPGDAWVHSVHGSLLRDRGNLTEAARAYDEALAFEPQRPAALHGRARVALERGEDEAVFRYRRAVAAQPHDLELQLGLAEALERQGDPSATQTLASAVAMRPDWVEGQRVLARMRWEAGEGRHFTSDLEHALARSPDDRALWQTYASALAGADLFAEAADAASAGQRSVGRDPNLASIEAICASEAGDLGRADLAFDLIPDTYPSKRLNQARHELRRGDMAAAARLLDQARSEDRWSVQAWALTGLVWRLTGDPRATWLNREEELVETASLPLDPEQLRAVAEKLRDLHRVRAHPIGQSLRGGTQTRGRLFQREDSAVVILRQSIEKAVGRYWNGLPQSDPDHPLLRHRESVPMIEGSWSVRLTDGGFHVAHCHPNGIVSSAVYLVIPSTTRVGEGWLEIGGPPAGLNLPLNPILSIEPIPGQIALFPSYMFHGTRQFSRGERLTCAFDIIA